MGDYAAITPEKLYFNLNFTSFGCSDEKSFWYCISITNKVYPLFSVLDPTVLFFLL